MGTRKIMENNLKEILCEIKDFKFQEILEVKLHIQKDCEKSVIGHFDSKQDVITNALQLPKRLDATTKLNKLKILNSFSTYRHTGSACQSDTVPQF